MPSTVLVLSYDGGSPTSVPIRVWYPVETVVGMADAELNRISGVSAARDCDNAAYQRTTASAIATFSDDSSITVGGVDVSHLVAFDASGDAVSLTGRDIVGVAPGQATVALLDVRSVKEAHLPEILVMGRSSLILKDVLQVAVSHVRKSWLSMVCHTSLRPSRPPPRGLGPSRSGDILLSRRYILRRNLWRSSLPL